MRRLVASVLGMVGALLLACSLAATPARAAVSEPQLTQAQAALVEDSRGNVLYSMNADARINPASITKIMTAVVALESGKDLDATYTLQGVTLDENAQIAGYQAGMTSTLRDLMRVMLVYSANDAASEVAIACAGSEAAFVQKMNDKAAELGMTNTHFVNPHGLDADGHYSSASDLVLLGRYALEHYPLIARYVSTKSVTVPVGSVQRTFDSTDEFMKSYPGGLGIKTGLGNTVANFLGASRRDGVTIYSCVLGCETSEGRFEDTRILHDWVWGTFGRYELADSSLAISVRPFAYHFGLSTLVTADASTVGLVWPDGGATTYERYLGTPGSLGVPGTSVGTCQWTQDTRTVATVTYSARPGLVRSYSGFGLLDQQMHYAPALMPGA